MQIFYKYELLKILLTINKYIYWKIFQRNMEFCGKKFAVLSIDCMVKARINAAVFMDTNDSCFKVRNAVKGLLYPNQTFPYTHQL